MRENELMVGLRCESDDCDNAVVVFDDDYDPECSLCGGKLLETSVLAREE